MPASAAGQLPHEWLVSPPSPTTPWSDAQGFSVQAPTLRFAVDARPAGCSLDARTAAGERSSPLDLRAFAPAVAVQPGRWRHAIRHLDPESRLRVHELVDLEGFDGSTVVATLRRGFWELRAARQETVVRPVDAQRRVSVPLGVRHQLGLQGPVVISLAADRSRIGVWSSVGLDQLLEVQP